MFSWQLCRWIYGTFIINLLSSALISVEAIRCYCTDEHCVPYGVCESNVCLVGLLKSSNAVIRTCGDEPVGCQRDVGKWADLCVCDKQFCNTFSYLRANTRRDRHTGHDERALAPPLLPDDVEDDPPVIFQRVDSPNGEFSGYDRPPMNTFPSQGSTNTLVFVLVPFSVGCVIVIIVWINYYRNLC